MTKASRHYIGKKGDEYYKTHFTDMEIGRILQSRYFSPYCANDKILLDFGCSDGLFLLNLPAKKRIGIEVNPAAVEKGAELCRFYGHNIDFYNSLDPIAPASVDVAISNHSLEHLLNPYEIACQMKRILKPGGIFISVTPFDDWRDTPQNQWSPGDRNHHLYTWSPLNLGNLLTEGGLKVKECRIVSSAWSPKLFWIYRIFGDNIFRAACQLFAIMKNRREVFCRATNE
jgi:SAM-dependent methyltransferase